MVDLTATDPGDGAFVVEIERFTGPLDLLLHLIREQDIDIFDIPIASITAQFLEAIEGIEQYGLDRAGEFLETAALLIRIKVQMVLPRRSLDGEVWEDPRAELVRRLLEYEHYREAAARLEQAEAEHRLRYARGFVPPQPTVVVTELTLAWEDVWLAVLNVGERARPRAEHHVTPRMVPLEDKMGLIVQALKRLKRVEFSHLVRPFADKLHGVVTLLAGLELAKRRELKLRQRTPFAALWFYKKKDRTGDAADTNR